MMKAILVQEPGGIEQMKPGEYPITEPGDNEILLKVKAAGVNRADILQRRGKYPPPVGASQVLGLEIAGIVEKASATVTKWKKGDRVFGLLSGGGYAEYAVIHEDMAMKIPEHLDYEEAAAIPEVFLTAFQALKWTGKLEQDELVLVHAGGSGVGTAAIQLGKLFGAIVAITASSSKLEKCRQLGADLTIDYNNQDFSSEIKKFKPAGANLIIVLGEEPEYIGYRW